MYLLDTVVISELRKRQRDANVAVWLASIKNDELHLSTVTTYEIQLGIERQRTVNPPFANDVARWLDLVVRAYGDRILPLTVPITRRWGRLAAQIGHQELDLAIAATALEYGLTVVTRNVSHFAPTGAATLDPFQPPVRRK
jgi:predicted nucleic acid-binding protein